MRIIAVCLKENAGVPIIGCAILNNDSTVDSICCVDDSNPMKVIEVTPEEFTTNIKQSIESNTEPIFTNYSSDVLKGADVSGSIQALRSVKGTTIFKKSLQAVFLENYNDIIYIWYSGHYYAIKKCFLDNKVKVKTSEDAENKLRLQLTKTVFDLLSSNDLKDVVDNSMQYMVDDLGMDREEAQNFILESFDYTSKSFGVQIRKSKLRTLLGLNPRGPLRKAKSVSNGQLELDLNIGDSTNLENYVDGIENIQVVNVNTSFNPNKVNLDEMLNTIKDDVDEKLNEYKEDLDSDIEYNISVTDVRDENGEQTLMNMKDILNIKPLMNEIVDSINQSEFGDGDPNCSKCHGKGFYEEDNFGIVMKIKCPCVDRYRELKHSKNSSYKGSLKEEVKKKPIILEAMTSGLIPRRRANDLLDFREMGDRVAALCRESGEKVDMQAFENYKNAMRNVLAYLSSNQELDYSLLLSAPNGFGKTTFVYSCLKLMLMNGLRVVPFISLFELSQLRYDYMNNTTWRHLDGYNKTDTEERIMKEASYSNLLTNNFKKKSVDNDLEETEIETSVNKPFYEMTDSEKDAYIMDIKSKKYTYKDYLDSDILFCQLSVAEQAYLEISTLKAILDYRGLRCKPTIIITDRDIETYKKTTGMATDVYFLNDMLTKDYKYATYDRAYMVTVKKERKRGLNVKAGETV